jgi:hypothetical protein
MCQLAAPLHTDANGPLLSIRGGGAVACATFVSEFRERHEGHRYGSRLAGSPAIVMGRSHLGSHLGSHGDSQLGSSRSHGTSYSLHGGSSGPQGGSSGSHADSSGSHADSPRSHGDSSGSHGDSSGSHGGPHSSHGGPPGSQDGPRGGVVALISPHLEDGSDARSLTPFANAVRLASRGSLYQRFVEAEWAQRSQRATDACGAAGMSAADGELSAPDREVLSPGLAANAYFATATDDAAKPPLR